MAWTNTLKLTLESSSVTAGLATINRGVNTAVGGMGKLAGAATSAGSKMASAFKGAGDVLFKLPDQVRALSGILNTLSLPSKLAGSAETTAVAFRVLIGDAAKSEEVLGRIRDLAAATPFEFPELADAARKLAAFGEEADSIPETLRRIGDMASATGAGITELAEIYGKARVQGTLFAEDLNQLTGRGIPVLQEFAKQLGVGVDQIKSLAADGKITFPMLEEAFKSLTGEGGKFAGMMEEISGTFDGKLSTLTDSVKTLLAKMGEGVNEGLKPVFDELTRQLDGQQGLAKSIGEKLGFGIEVAMEALKDQSAIDILSAGLEVAALNFAALVMEAISDMGDAIRDKFDWLPGVDTVAEANERGSVASEARGAADMAENRYSYLKNRPVQKVQKKREERAAAAEQKQAEDDADKAMRESGSWQAVNKTGQYEYNEATGSNSGAWDAETVKAVKDAADAQAEYERLVAPSAPAVAGSATKSPAGGGIMESFNNTVSAVTAGGVSGGGHRIKGAVNAGQSYQWEGDRKIPFAGGMDRADRMAGMGNGQRREAQAGERSTDLIMKAATLLIKHLPAIAQDVHITAQN